ncbi:MAG: serine hydrolase family protein [Candidatus Yanofskybacteria bacterium]|nr:serine hydrolase family protein [Candidatus Yanofskybacteria bacterium]
MKRVFIIHGWDGYPEENWFPWLKRELEAKGFEVFVPQLPDAENPKIEKWVPAVANVIGSVNEDTYFVGHSIGCQTIARFLENQSEDVQAGGAIFVAGFFKRLTNMEDEEVKETADSWFNSPIDFSKVKKRLIKSVAIFSDDDEYVPLDNVDYFRDKLGSKIIIEHNKGHFNTKAGVTELPVVLEELLKMSE